MSNMTSCLCGNKYFGRQVSSACLSGFTHVQADNTCQMEDVAHTGFGSCQYQVLCPLHQARHSCLSLVCSQMPTTGQHRGSSGGLWSWRDLCKPQLGVGICLVRRGMEKLPTSTAQPWCPSLQHGWTGPGTGSPRCYSLRLVVVLSGSERGGSRTLIHSVGCQRPHLLGRNKAKDVSLLSGMFLVAQQSHFGEFIFNR